MDTLSHACLGALLARAGQPSLPPKAARWWLVAGAIAAAAPDLDYLSFWLNPYRFHTEWHRGPTHSLVLMPLWATLLALLFRSIARSESLRPWLGLAALGLSSHIATDLLTYYGTQLFYPLSTTRYALGTSFVVDAYFSLIVATGLALSLVRRTWAWPALAALAAYLLFQAQLRQEALQLAAQEQARLYWPEARIEAYPQPLSPYHWLLILSDDERLHQTRVRLRAGSPAWLAQWPWLTEFSTPFQAPERAIWQDETRFGGNALAQTLWQHEAMAPFRRFAYEPRLYRIDDEGGMRCVWYSDAAFELPGQTPPFRYGLCQETGATDWRLHRLRLWTANEHESLPQ